VAATAWPFAARRGRGAARAHQLASLHAP
jgi:hypothetical protein